MTRLNCTLRRYRHYRVQAANNNGANQTARMCRLIAPSLVVYGINRFPRDVAQMSYTKEKQRAHMKETGCFYIYVRLLMGFKEHRHK